MDQASGIAQFIPLLLISGIFGGMTAWAASKLGKNKVLWFILGALPAINFVSLWVLIWSTTIQIDRRLKVIEERIGKSEPSV